MPRTSSLGLSGIFVTILSTYLIVALVILVLEIIAKWRLFEKAGEAGWKSIIPIYNAVIEFKIAGLSPWLLLLTLAGAVPVVGSFLVLGLVVYEKVKLGEAFGKSGGFIVGMILLPTIFDLILGFDSSKYQGVKEEI